MCEDRYPVIGADARTVDCIERYGVDAALLHTGEGVQGRVVIETCGDSILAPVVVLGDDEEERVGIECNDLLHTETLPI